ncbi:glutamate racemase [Acinetobacter larvae]|uniref:Glutamate racemase n=1 Tax=Acinetobacter larvae TaxID=1789224 RepID=A0A1B2LW87_9GAMM|nr:glutamate racemase [Acinetobacter larvae]AOA57216.1 glutamate racemase [Acinetobacter larvae]
MTVNFSCDSRAEHAMASRAHAPIGIFDSGVGGLSVTQDIASYLPHEQFLYYADTAHVPYGPRHDDDIRQLTAQGIDWLYQQGCKAAVVACNTASAFSLADLRQHYGPNFPIIGLVPALKPAVLQSQSKVVAVMATPATFRGALIQDVIENFAKPAAVQVLALTCLDLVPYVEAGEVQSAACRDSLVQVLAPAVAQGADFLVQGCTHYPFLNPVIQAVYPQLKLIDSGMAVARQTARVLIQHGLQATAAHASNAIRIHYYGTALADAQLQQTLKHLIRPTFNWAMYTAR